MKGDGASSTSRSTRSRSGSTALEKPKRATPASRPTPATRQGDAARRRRGRRRRCEAARVGEEDDLARPASRAHGRAARRGRPRSAPASCRPARPRARSAAARPRRRRPWRCRSTSTCGCATCCRCRASAPSSTKSSFVTSPISTTSKRPSSGTRVGCELHPAAVPAAVGDDHVVHRPAALVVVERHGHLGVLPARRTRATARRRTSRARRARFDIEFARCATAPLIPAEPTFANQRSASAPAGVAVVDAAEVDVPRRPRRARPAPRRRSRSGSRASARSPARCRPGSTAISASSPAIPFTTSFSVPSPPTTTSSRASRPPRARARSRCPGRSESSTSPVSPSSSARRVELRPALPRRAVRARRVDEEDGPPRAAQTSRRPRRRARAASSGRPRRAAPRR